MKRLLLFAPLIVIAALLAVVSIPTFTFAGNDSNQIGFSVKNGTVRYLKIVGTNQHGENAEWLWDQAWRERWPQGASSLSTTGWWWKGTVYLSFYVDNKGERACTIDSLLINPHSDFTYIYYDEALGCCPDVVGGRTRDDLPPPTTAVPTTPPNDCIFECERQQECPPTCTNPCEQRCTKPPTPTPTAPSCEQRCPPTPTPPCEQRCPPTATPSPTVPSCKPGPGCQSVLPGDLPSTGGPMEEGDGMSYPSQAEVSPTPIDSATELTNMSPIEF